MKKTSEYQIERVFSKDGLTIEEVMIDYLILKYEIDTSKGVQNE